MTGLSSGNLNPAGCLFKSGPGVSLLGIFVLIRRTFDRQVAGDRCFETLLDGSDYSLGLVTAGAFLVILKGVEIDGSELPLSPSRFGRQAGRTCCRNPPPEIESYRPGVTKP